MAEQMNVGIVGAVTRGSGFAKSLGLTGFFRGHALCDIDEEGLGRIQAETGASETYTDYWEMLEKADIQAVMIGTPMPFHAPMAIAALEKDLHVLCEVTAAVSVDESRDLVAAASQSDGIYMMAENYTFRKPNMMVRDLVAHGLFGEPYYAEGEYLHELKALNEKTPWRRRWQTGINGVTYGTHSLGPILQWMPGDRVTSVCGMGSGHHYRDPRGDWYENEDTSLMLCRMASGGLVKIRVDMLSDRPHAMTNYSLQGTDGAYESSRAPGEPDRIWLRSRNDRPDAWENLTNLEPEHTPDAWKDEEILRNVGHGGGDLLELLAFRDVILGRRKNDLDIHHAMDMTLPGLISQLSTEKEGIWLEVPDSRIWVTNA
jgi:predicted dehydrogenase